jgi:hypothetical protein
MKNDVFTTLLCYISTFGIVGTEGQLLQKAMQNITEMGIAALQPIVPCLILSEVVACIHLIAEANIRQRQRGTSFTCPEPVINKLR